MGQSAMSATELRSKLYRVLDEIERTGVPQLVSRKGSSFLIVPTAARRGKLGDFPGTPVLACTLDELVATTWEDSWDREP